MDIYIGPYLKVTNLPKITFDRSYTICANKECTNFNNSLTSAFCPNCGSACSKNTIVKSAEISIDTLLDQFGDCDILALALDFHSSNIEAECIYIPNAIITDLRDHILHLNASDYLDIFEVSDKALGLEAFNIEYKELLDFFTTKGVEYEIKYGIINY